MKSFITLLVAVAVLGGVIGGALIGGVAIGKSQGEAQASQELQSSMSQLASRFRQTATPQVTQQQTATPQSTPLPGSLQPDGFAGLLGMRGTAGTVEKIEGNVITLSTTQGSVRVLIGENTSIQKMGEGSLSDISPGQTLTVSGERKDDGSITATSISIATRLQTR